MNGPQTHHAEWQKPYTKELIQFIWSLEQGKVIYGKKKISEQLLRIGVGLTGKSMSEFTGGIGMFCIFIGVWVTEVYASYALAKIYQIVHLRIVFHTIMK